MNNHRFESNLKGNEVPAMFKPSTSTFPPLKKAEGIKHDQAKVRVDLLAPDALEGIATILTHGAKKYGDRNWELGMDWSRPYAAALRHLWAWWKGETIDPESGLPHLDHAACNIMFLSAYEKRKKGNDNRPKQAQDNTREAISSVSSEGC